MFRFYLKVNIIAMKMRLMNDQPPIPDLKPKNDVVLTDVGCNIVFQLTHLRN